MVAATGIDESSLVWIAATAAGIDPMTVLDATDMRALTRAVALAERGGTAWDRLAVLLEAMLLDPPFPTARRATAWLAVVMAARASRLQVEVRDGDVPELLRSVERGDIDARELAAILSGENANWSVSTRVIGACPACGRALHVLPHERSARQLVLVGISRFELVGRCAYEHRAHDQRGEQRLPARTATASHRWRPVVTGCPTGSVIVLVDSGLLVLVPNGVGKWNAWWRDDVSAGELTTRWDDLAARGEFLGDLPAGAVQFDAHGRSIDVDTAAEAASGDRLAALLGRQPRLVLA